MSDPVPAIVVRALLAFGVMLVLLEIVRRIGGARAPLLAGLQRAMRLDAMRRSQAPARLAILESRVLPGGASLHLVRCEGRTVLVGRAPQSLCVLAEFRSGEDSRAADDAATQRGRGPCGC
ncbi:MAG: flagellar biosynthetic protein FliO [Vulcanimicrobiaceae bacterium]